MDTIGVIVITYNGQSYIYQQLNSIRCQTVTPDCVLIFDDCSTDNTVSIIQNFIKENDLHNWKLNVNKENVGWIKNCINAISSCKTDIIFWSDQDDEWETKKIELMMSAIQNTQCLAVYSCWSYINSSGEKLNYVTGHGTDKTISIKPSNKNSTIPPMLGCSVCFKRELAKKLITVLPCAFDSPDWLLFRIGVTTGKILYIDQPLFKRRIHENNVTTSKKTLRRNWKFSYKKHCEMIDVLTIQLKTLDKIMFLTKQQNHNLNSFFVAEERNYLYYRVNFLKYHKNFIEYIFYSLKQNGFVDFINSFIKDFRFIAANKKDY